jgi:hypothetical protein
MSFEIGQIAGGYEFVSVQGNTRIGRGYKVRNVLAERLEVLRVLPKEPNLGREEIRTGNHVPVHSEKGLPRGRPLGNWRMYATSSSISTTHGA